MEKIESFDQAKQAQVMNVGDDYSPQTGPHPAQVVPFFTSRSSPTSLDHKRPMAFSPQTLLYNPATVPQLTSTGQQYVSAERDKYTKMKLRKEAKKDRAERKFKTVINDGDQENYNIDNVLQKLGEAEPGKNKSSNKGNNSNKKSKVERKRSKNKKETSAQNSDIKETCPSSGTEDEDEDDEDKQRKNSVKSPTPPTNAAETFSTNFSMASSSTSSSVINGSSSNTSSVNLTRQTSRSTEDLFTPVIKKQKWKNRKVVSLTTKDDSGHTYSSSSSSSSTTSTSAIVTSSANDKQR